MPHGTKKYQSSKLLNYSFIKHFLSKSLSIRRITHNAHNFVSTDAMNEGTALHEIIQNKITDLGGGGICPKCSNVKRWEGASRRNRHTSLLIPKLKGI